MDASLSSSTPNLPGFTNNQPDMSGKKKKGFTIRHGVMMEVPETIRPPRDLNLSNSNSSLAASMTKSLTPSKGSKIPGFVEKANLVLAFNCYFQEAVVEAQENHRVRKCQLAYYLEDETIEIKEIKQENSGMPQGNFVKRHNVPHSCEDRNICLDDLMIGEQLSIYGRTFFITGCNSSTRDWLTRDGRIVPPNQIPRNDPYEVKRAEFMSRETGADFSVSRNVQRNPMKKFAEATLGNTVNNTGLEGFLKYPNIVLNFDAVWDDRTALYGDLMRYKIQYFMCDNTIEVLECHTANMGRDPFPKLLRRQRLEKNWSTNDANGRADEASDADYYSYEDLAVGQTINIYNRQCKIIDADGATRKFLASKGINLSPAISIDDEGGRKLPEFVVPPHNGWGTEEDSLGSCIALVPKPPKTQFDIHGAKLPSNKLQFEAKMVTSHPDDVDRKFIIQFFVEDGKIKVHEPAQRNSGVIGGTFLAKKIWENPATGKAFAETDFCMGARVRFQLKGHSGHDFVITDVDEATLKYMEGKPSKFPLSDIKAVERRMKASLGDSVRQLFLRYDTDHSGHITIDEFTQMIEECTGEPVDPQVRITLMRNYDKNKDGKINYNEFQRGLGTEASGEAESSYNAVAEQAAAQERFQLHKTALIQQFSKGLDDAGTLTSQVQRIAGRKNYIDRQAFIKAVSQSQDASDSDSWNMYLTNEDAGFLADVIFGDTDAYDLTEFTNIILSLQ